MAHLPEGYRTTLRSHTSLTILHGDIPNPARGVEPATGDPIVGNDAPQLAPADIVVGVDSALGSPVPSGGILECDDEQNEPLPLAATPMRPKLYLGAHQEERTVDRTVSYGNDSDTFETRVIRLARNDGGQLSQGVLAVRTGDVALFARDDDAVTELTGGEHGVWTVQTQSSQYVFDLDHGTVTRQPGRTAIATINDVTRRLRAIERCKVGESGYWTMKSDDPYPNLTDFYWAMSTEIRSIERMRHPDA